MQKQKQKPKLAPATVIYVDGLRKFEKAIMTILAQVCPFAPPEVRTSEQMQQAIHDMQEAQSQMAMAVTMGVASAFKRKETVDDQMEG